MGKKRDLRASRSEGSVSDLQIFAGLVIWLGNAVLCFLFYIFGQDHERCAQARKDAAAAQRIREAIRSHDEPPRFVPLAGAPAESILCQPDGGEQRCAVTPNKGLG